MSDEQDTPLIASIPGVEQAPPPSAFMPGVAALLLQRGCPENQLDEVLATMAAWPLPAMPSEAVEHVDRAIATLMPER